MRDEGTYADKETGLVYNVNRYRDLSSGRFIQPDPLGLDGGDLSLYVLRGNNPLSFTDPLGLWVWGDPLDQDLVNAITGFGDAFLLPELVRNAFEISGGVNQCSAAYRYGKVAGFLTGSAPFALRGAAALGATSFGRTIGLNSGRYWRIGPGVWKKNVGLGVPPGGSNIVPRLSIGPQRAGAANPHFDLRSRFPYVPPVGGPNCDCQ